MLPPVTEVTLDNGFRALLVPRRGLPLVACTTWYHVGSRDEGAGETGLSHFLEHMMFKGSARYGKGEIDLLTSKLGGSNNASTDQDNTAYYFALAADRWQTALEIEADRIVHCALAEAEFEAEKQVVLEELAMGEDDPTTVLFHEVDALSYQVHPYHHPIIGWREDVGAVRVDQMRDYYRRHYGPNRAFLVAVGDLDPAATAELVAELFGGLARVADRRTVTAEPRASGERRSWVRTPGPLKRLAMAVPSCRMGERDDFTLDILANVFGGGRTSRLYRRLVVDDELCTHAAAFNHPRLDPGLWGVWAELRPGVEPERVEAAVRAELDHLCAEGVTTAELRRARVQVTASFRFDAETALGLALTVGRFEALCAAGYRLLDAVVPTYDSITRGEVRRVANRYLAVDGWSVVHAVPRDANGRARAVLTEPRRRRRTRNKAAADRAAE